MPDLAVSWESVNLLKMAFRANMTVKKMRENGSSVLQEMSPHHRPASVQW
jgi:hypothetical protein